LLAGVEEGGSGRLEPPGDGFADDLHRGVLVAARRVRRPLAAPVLEALPVGLAVEGLQRVGGVDLEGAQEGGEGELGRVGGLPELVDERAAVLLQRLGLVVVVLDQVVQLLIQVVEEDCVDVDVLQEVLVRSQLISLKLNLTVRTVEIQHGVELVVAQALPLRGNLLGQGWLVYTVKRLDCCFQNSSNPLWTLDTSSSVPINSNLYICGTAHFWATMSPAMQ